MWRFSVGTWESTHTHTHSVWNEALLGTGQLRRLEKDDVLLAELFWVDLVEGGRPVGLGVWTGALRRVKEGADALGGGRGLHGELWVGRRGGHRGFVEIGRVGGAGGRLGVCGGALWSAEVICRRHQRATVKQQRVPLETSKFPQISH